VGDKIKAVIFLFCHSKLLVYFLGYFRIYDKQMHGNSFSDVRSFLLAMGQDVFVDATQVKKTYFLLV